MARTTSSISRSSASRSSWSRSRPLKAARKIAFERSAPVVAYSTIVSTVSLPFRDDQRRYPHAAARWLARYYADVEGVTLTDIREIADLMAALPMHGKPAADDLAARLAARGLQRCARMVRDLAEDPPRWYTA